VAREGIVLGMGIVARDGIMDESNQEQQQSTKYRRRKVG
jgi:hypothetical protein